MYNKEVYLDRCIRSVISQSYCNLEIIIINDGSQDKSDEIIENWVLKDSRIKYFRQSNQGVSSTRNRGISLAKGDYFYFLDADDEVKMDAIEKLVINAQKYNADIIMSNFLIKRNNTLYKSHRFRSYFIEKDSLGSSQVKADMFLNNGRPMSSACNKLYKANFVKDNEIKFEEGVLAEDRLFNLICYVNNPSLSLLNEYTYIINVIESSRSRAINHNYYNESISLFYLFYNYLKSQNKILQNEDLIQYNLIFDIDKILSYSYKNSRKKVSTVYNDIKKLKNNNLVYETIRKSIKQKNLLKVEGGKKYFIRVWFGNQLFLYTPKFVYTLFSILFLKYKSFE